MNKKDVSIIIPIYNVEKYGLYRFCPWIAHAKTVSQISPSNGALFKIKV